MDHNNIPSPLKLISWLCYGAALICVVVAVQLEDMYLLIDAAAAVIAGVFVAAFDQVVVLLTDIKQQITDKRDDATPVKTESPSQASISLADLGDAIEKAKRSQSQS